MAGMDSLKTKERKDKEFFFGPDLKMTSGYYFKFRHFIDNDNIIILTNNIATVKESQILVVFNNKGVYLKDWQLRKVTSHAEGIECYAVKLNRKFFSPYEFKFSFKQFKFDTEATFEKLIEMAKEQDKANIAVKEIQQ